MARKPPKLEHVKFVHRNGRIYAYFNTGQKRDGKPIYAAMGSPASAGFFDRYASFKAGRTRREAKGYTVADLVTDYLASATYAKLADNTRSNYAVQADKIKEAWGDFTANDLLPVDVRMVLESGAWGAGTCNMVLAVIGTIYKWGRRNKELTVNPTRDVDRQEVGAHEPWPEDVLEAAFVSDDATVRLAVHLLYFTGQRIGDVMKMRWGDIRGGHIYVKQQKTGKVVEPPLISDLSAELDRTPKTSLYIIDGITASKLRHRLQRFTAKLGAKTVPHGLRKNAVIAFLEASCTVPEVAAITGQTHQVVEHYAAQVNRRRLGKAAVVKFEAQRARNKKATGKRSGKSGVTS